MYPPCKPYISPLAVQCPHCGQKTFATQRMRTSGTHPIICGTCNSLYVVETQADTILVESPPIER